MSKTDETKTEQPAAPAPVEPKKPAAGKDESKPDPALIARTHIGGVRVSPDSAA